VAPTPAPTIVRGDTKTKLSLDAEWGYIDVEENVSAHMHTSPRPSNASTLPRPPTLKEQREAQNRAPASSASLHIAHHTAQSQDDDDEASFGFDAQPAPAFVLKVDGVDSEQSKEDPNTVATPKAIRSRPQSNASQLFSDQADT
jgi:hypothetical protein